MNQADEIIRTFGDSSLALDNDNKPNEDSCLYLPFGESVKTDGFIVRYSDNSIAAISWGYFIEALLTSVKFISVICTHRIILIEGNNFTDNEVKLFRDKLVSYIKPFDSKKFNEVEGHEPIVHKITWERPKQSMEG